MPHTGIENKPLTKFMYIASKELRYQSRGVGQDGSRMVHMSTHPVNKQVDFRQCAKRLGTTNMLEWVQTTNKHQNDLLCARMHRKQYC